MLTPPQTYRMLTVQQPWADFLVPDAKVIARLTAAVDLPWEQMLPKDVENRGFGTSWRGTLFIHAGQRVDRDAMTRFGLAPDGFVVGAVVGVVRLVDVVTDSTSEWAEPGRKQWQVVEPVRLESPVECAGFQGPRTPTQPVLVSVLSQLSHQRELAGQS